MSKKISVINSIVQSSDEDLCHGIIEIMQWRKTGILVEGFVRYCAKEIEKNFNIPISTSIKISEDGILETAARRFVKKNTARGLIMGIGFKGIVKSIICTEFEKNVGRWQSKENEPKAMLVTFRLGVDYKIEEGYRHLDLIIYGPQNYVGVFARERWVVIPREDLECDDCFDTMVKKGAYYREGQTPWMMEGYHDSCWRDAVDRVIWANQDRITGINNRSSYWYDKIQATEEFLKKLGPLMRREGDYRYEAGKGVLFFNNNEIANENKNQ